MGRIKDPLTGEVKDKGVTNFTPTPDELPPLTSAASYSKRVEAKRQAVADAKSKKVPLGHADPIPEGKLRPIADAARAAQMPQPDWGAMPSPTELPDEPSEEELEEWAAPPTPKVKGVGAGYEVNQAMAQGKVDRPLNLRESRELATKQRQELEERQRRAEEAAAAAEAQAEREALPAAKEGLEDAEKELAERNIFEFFDPAAMQKARIPLLDEKRREVIEGRLKPLDFEDLITRREIQQNVEILPGKFSVGLRTVREKEHLWILQYLYEKTGVSSPAHVDELNSVCRIACAVRSINGRLLPEHRDDVGQPNEDINPEKFEKKLEIILGFPTQIVADLGVQFNWFSDRVNALFSVDELKNG